MKPKIPINRKEQDIKKFDETANDPKLWLLRAEDLHTASKVLREKVTSLKFDPQKDLTAALACLPYVGLVFQSAMLQGFSIEVFLKAYWLIQGNALSKNGEYHLSALKRDNHNLLAIADAIGFKLTREERNTLPRLSLFVSSYGRYPITKRWSENPLRKGKSGIPHRLAWGNEDHNVTEKLINKLRAATKKP